MTETDDELKTVAILALQSPIISASHEQWQRVAEMLSNRLQHPACVVQVANEDDSLDALQPTIQSYTEQGFRRFVVLPIGLEPFSLHVLQSAITWIRSETSGVNIYVARSWTLKDWADALYPAFFDAAKTNIASLEQACSGRKDVTVLLLSHGDDSGPDVGLEVASLAYYCRQSDENMDLRYAFLRRRNPSLVNALRRMDSDGVQNVVLFPWRMNSTQIVNLFLEFGSLPEIAISPEVFGVAWTWNRLSHEQPRSFCLLEHSGWIHVVVGMYLDALASRSIERYFLTSQNKLNATEMAMQKSLIAFDIELDSLLPSEYQGRTDEVKSQSMGSAQIHTDKFGEVAWDEIWTSFCDLALAGGPPHRGRLLEAITAEQANKDISAYDVVVREIRRGIEMVTGLETIESEVLGWIGVVCDDEAMAIWLMRAIIVENVMVRREGSVVFLPAGPDFRVKKEIMNFITSVAKTVHYWRAHLRLV